MTIRRTQKDSGIYVQHTVEAENAEDMKAIIALAKQEFEEQTDLDLQLLRIERHAAAASKGDPEAIETEDAIRVLFTLDELRRALDDGNIRSAALAAMYLGSRYERLKIRWAEPYAGRAQKSEQALVKKAKARGRSADEKNQALTEFDRLRAEFPHLTVAAIEKRVTEETGVSARQLRRYRKDRDNS
jgi:hypothetical protein